MRLISALATAFLLGVTLQGHRPVQAEVLGPGAYAGWIVQDRWGDVFLANGVYLLPFRGASRAAALRWKGKPVTVDVSEILGDGDDHGIGAIAGIKPAEPVHGGRLQLQLTRTEIALPLPRRQKLGVTLRYEGSEPLRFDCRRLAVVLRRVGGSLPGDKSGRPPNFRGRDAQGTDWVSGGASLDVLEGGERVRNLQVYKAPGGSFEASGAFTYSTELGLELPAGQYEMFAIYSGWNCSNYSGAPGPRSAVERVDVVASR